MERLDEAITVLASGGVYMSREELLDALWLAGRLPESDAEGAPLERPAARHGGALPDARPGPARPPATPAVPAATTPPGPAPRTGAPPQDTPPIPRPQPHEAPPTRPRPDRRPADRALRGLYGGGHTPGGPGPDAESPEARRGLPLRVPEDKALHHELSIGRALRPLKQHRPNPLKREFDEVATAAALAETGLPDVVTRPARERWLDLALVVDDGTSMLLWRRLAVELRTVLQRSGAFRVVRVLGLHTRGAEAPALRTRPYDPDAPRLPTTALSDPSGHTLVLVVSDGVGSAWRDGRMAQVLARWAGVGPTAVVHALPPRLWDSSGIRTRRWQVRTRRPGSANADWAVADPVLPTALARFDGVPVPVLEPEAAPLADWARLIASASGTAVLPLLAPPRGGPVAPASRPAPSPADELGRVQLFRDAASPEAYRLAAHLSAVAPLPVPVMRMVQKAVDGRSDTGRLAEVFLGGLMRPAPPPASAGPDPLPPEHRPFAFTDAAQQALLGAVPLAELVATSRTIGRRLEELAGRSPDFPAWLAHTAGTDRLPPGARPFSTVERRLAARLGAPPPLPSAFATRAAAQHWRRLEPGDPRAIGPYRLTMAGPPGARLTPYLGQDAYGAQAVVQTARRVRGQDSVALLNVQVEALRRMDGRYARRLLREGLDDDVPWLAEEPFVGERLDYVLRGDAEQWGDRLDDALRTGPEHWDGHTALALARQVADAVRLCGEADMAHGDLTVSTVHVAGEDILLTGWSSACIDGVPSPAFLGDRAPTAEDNVRALGDILLWLGGGARTRRPGPGLYFMPRWSSAVWEPVRALVMSCRERPGQHTARQVWEFLTEFRPDAPRAPKRRLRLAARGDVCSLCDNPLEAGDRFCDACGADLTTAPPRSTSSADGFEPSSGLPSFAEYQSYRRLGGSGGYDVYLARDERRSRDVVIRTAPEAERHLRAEVEALRRMSGHYAPRWIAGAFHHTPPWIVTECVSLPDGSPAPPLSSFLTGGGPRLDPVHAATIGLRLAEAVNMCALKGIVLRRLTADSVLVVGRTVKLIGWTDASLDNVRSPKAPTRADNIYALGEILRAVSDAQPTARLSQTDALWREPQLLAIIGACLDERPERRPTAGHVADVFVQCLPSVPHSYPYDIGPSDTQVPHEAPDTAAPAPVSPARPRRVASRFRFGARAREAERQRRTDLIRTPLTAAHRVAVIGRRAEIGSTATTLALGATLAVERQGNVLAVDAATFGNSLSRRIRHETTANVRDLAHNSPMLVHQSIRHYTTRLPSGLDVLAGRDALTDEEYRRVIEALSGFYPLILTDWAADDLHTRRREVVDLADQLIIVTSPSEGRTRSAHTILSRLAGDGHPDLARHAITVFTTPSETGTGPSEDLVEEYRARCRGVVVVPYDAHVAAQGEIDLEQLAPKTRDAYVDLAALVAEGFPGAGP
ncbi:SAV_2336 N-terminal domain-related protein [Streptomyces sp. NBRC 110028]|uniref:SAV_2336 N-terminal domain-related protein n=1 Tax=Streptomyces sp. NBRC 110028 TaxID=1621260 RepID=UPI002279AFCF|nr:SAV_2336 N-terminal domain-related protein [Streptomyces sp. NBRC 110028]